MWLFSFVSSFSFAGKPLPADLQNWNSAEEMRPYVHGIQYIREMLKPLYQKHNIYNASEFSVNPYYYRTSQYLFLETSFDNTDEEKLEKIWTPCGEVKLTNGGCFANLYAASKEFFSKMKPVWDVKEVSGIVKVYDNSHLIEDFFKGPDQYGGRYHLYLITRIKDPIFFPGPVTSGSDLILHARVAISGDQYKKDKDLFLKLSQEIKPVQE